MDLFSKVLVLVKGHNIDESVAAYINFLSRRIPIKELKNLHIFSALSLIKHLNENEKHKGDEIINRIKKTTEKKLEDKYRNLENIHTHILLGNPFQTIKNESRYWDPNPIVIGKLRKGASSLTNNIIRYTKSNILIIPKDVNHSLKHIFVALDLSDHSGKLMDKVLEMQKLIGPHVKITCFHAFDMPDFPYYLIGRTEKKFSKMIKSQYEESFDKFIKSHATDHVSNLNTVLIKESRHQPHKYILDYINNNDVDFAIIGTKSRPLIDYFLGSTAEKIANNNMKVPLLLIK